MLVEQSKNTLPPPPPKKNAFKDTKLKKNVYLPGLHSVQPVNSKHKDKNVFYMFLVEMSLV